MADLTLDEALPIARNLARRKGDSFVNRWHFAVGEREDIESHLVLTFIARWPKYDSQRASVQTFASRLMDHELISIVRYRLAQCRQARELPVPDTGPSSVSIHQFRIDLDRVTATMPGVYRETASALSRLSAVDAADELGCSRQTISNRKYQIREAFLAAGITPDYFTAGVRFTVSPRFAYIYGKDSTQQAGA